MNLIQILLPLLMILGTILIDDLSILVIYLSSWILTSVILFIISNRINHIPFKNSYYLIIISLSLLFYRIVFYLIFRQNEEMFLLIFPNEIIIYPLLLMILNTRNIVNIKENKSTINHFPISIAMMYLGGFSMYYIHTLNSAPYPKIASFFRLIFLIQLSAIFFVNISIIIIKKIVYKL